MQLWRTPIVRQLALLPLLLLLLGGIASGGGAQVLCVGADGHVELELGRFGECCAEGPAAVSEWADDSASMASCEGSCGECRDLALDPQALSARRLDADVHAISVDAAFESPDLRDLALPAHRVVSRSARLSRPLDLRPTLPILRI